MEQGWRFYAWDEQAGPLWALGRDTTATHDEQYQSDSAPSKRDSRPRALKPKGLDIDAASPSKERASHGDKAKDEDFSLGWWLVGIVLVHVVGYWWLL